MKRNLPRVVLSSFRSSKRRVQQQFFSSQNHQQQSLHDVEQPLQKPCHRRMVTVSVMEGGDDYHFGSVDMELEDHVNNNNNGCKAVNDDGDDEPIEVARSRRPSFDSLPSPSTSRETDDVGNRWHRNFSMRYRNRKGINFVSAQPSTTTIIRVDRGEESSGGVERLRDDFEDVCAHRDDCYRGAKDGNNNDGRHAITVNESFDKNDGGKGGGSPLFLWSLNLEDFDDESSSGCSATRNCCIKTLSKTPEIQVLHRDPAAHPERHYLRRGSADGSSATSSLASSVDDATGCFAEADTERCCASADDYAGGCQTSPSSSSVACSTTGASSKRIDYILEELLSTEESYVSELDSLVEFYVRPFEALEHSPMFPITLRGQSETLFGNICDLAAFHRRYVLSDLRRYCGRRQVADACRLFVSQRNNFLALYRPYCQNKPLSETLRASVAESGASDQHHQASVFFAECQRRAGHPLPLSAYLLKPIQRITKYQLLLKEMRKQYPSSADDEDTDEAVERREVDAALAAMLDLLTQLNADMQQLHILGFAGDLRLFGALRLQTESEVYAFKRKNHRLANKPQRRHLLLFDGGILFCKRRTQAAVSGGNGSTVGDVSEYFEHKLCIPIQNLGFAECSKWSPDRFEVWDETRNDGYAVRVIPVTDGDTTADDDAAEKCRAKWIARLARLTTLYAQRNHTACAPHGRNASTSLNHRHSYVSADSYQGGGLKPAERHQQYGSGLPPYGNNGSSGAGRPQSWTSSDGSCGNGPVMSLSSSGTTSSRSSDVIAGQDGPLGADMDGTTPVCETRSDANGNNNNDTVAMTAEPAASARQFGASGRILTNAAKYHIDVENNFTAGAASTEHHRFPSSATMSGLANTVPQHSSCGSGGIHTSRSLQNNVSSSLQTDFRSSPLKSSDTPPKTELIAK